MDMNGFPAPVFGTIYRPRIGDELRDPEVETGCVR